MTDLTQAYLEGLLTGVGVCALVALVITGLMMIFDRGDK